jgi:hypothetical protein
VDEPVVYARLGGPPAAIAAIGAEVLQRFPGEAMAEDEAGARWRAVGEFGWAQPGGALAKLAITPRDVPEFAAWVRAQPEARGWVSGGGNVGYVSRPAAATLAMSAWPGVTLRGDGALWLGPRRDFAVMQAVKAALDPRGRFPGLED